VAYQYPKSITIAADTTVIVGDHVINKPIDRADALDILVRLSGRMHEVITGVCMVKDSSEEFLIEDITKVYFKNLTTKQMEHYVDSHKPYDKAGAYAIQEWIGVTGIEKIEGDYFNVMGLPVNRVVSQLLAWGVPMPI
jgi:septum formation protein